jgi:small GTP-binding protein
LDEWKIQPGDEPSEKIREGLDNSRSLILAMSGNISPVEWPVLERYTALFRDVQNPDRRFVPILLDTSEIRDSLKQFASISWTQRTFDQYKIILSACHPSFQWTPSSREQEKDISPIAVLRGHAKMLFRVALTPDGRYAVSSSSDTTICAWNIGEGRLDRKLQGHTDTVIGTTISDDATHAASGSHDGTVRIWSLKNGKCIGGPFAHEGMVFGIATTPNGEIVISACSDSSLRVWDVKSGSLKMTLLGHTGPAWGVAVAANGNLAISCSSDKTIRLWDLNQGRLIATLKGHQHSVYNVAITSDGKRAVSVSEDRSVRVWNLETFQQIAILEGHSGAVRGIALTPDGRRALSSSVDETAILWDLKKGVLEAVLRGHTSTIYGVALTADGKRAASASADGTLMIWDLPALDLNEETEPASRYTNAKVLLVGDTGVGKSGLAYRLTENRFVPTMSTDAAWATQWKLPDSDVSGDIEREIWLWDFAGQADYRLIHQLYMDETSLAILVFNPQSEDPFEGLTEWDLNLSRAARRPFKKLLVAGRCDRGGLMISGETIELFREERKFENYVETSARTGQGCEDLRREIINHIPWEQIPWTLTRTIFRKLKEEIVRLKDEGKTLLRMSELKQQLELRLQEDSFSLDQIRAVVGLLAGPGVLWQLEFGDFILLQPELINAYAAAVIRRVRAHTDDIGCILEDRVLEGDIDYQGIKRLSPDAEQIVLRAMHQTFVDHGLCLRERTEQGILLVFPSYFKRKRPDLIDHPAVFVTYTFSGFLDEIYSTLVVRLHHTLAFDKDQLWRFAADFKTPAGKRLGLKVNKKGEGRGELLIYFEPGVPDDVKVTFIRYAHEHLQARASDIVRLRSYVCPICHTSVENRRTAQERLERGQQDIICVNCEQRVPLWDLIEQKFASEEFQARAKALEDQARASIDNESRELILVGHAFSIAGEAGQIFRPLANSDWGIDGEIELKDYKGEASGRRLYLQLKSGDSYLYKRQSDGAEIFTIRNARHAQYWRQQKYPVMLVIRTSDTLIRWMNISEFLQSKGKTAVKKIIFEGETFSALSLQKMRDRILGPPAPLAVRSSTDILP